jgi:hypothetical protein
MAAIFAGFAGYFVLLVHQIRAFEGSFRQPDFFTAQTVVSWCLYVLAGLFGAPLLVQSMVLRASTEPKGNGPAVLTALVLAAWTLLPDVVIQYAAFYDRASAAH